MLLLLETAEGVNLQGWQGEPINLPFNTHTRIALELMGIMWDAIILKGEQTALLCCTELKMCPFHCFIYQKKKKRKEKLKLKSHFGENLDVFSMNAQRLPQKT
ncbi:unnamed protein product [Natator depressus]